MFECRKIKRKEEKEKKKERKQPKPLAQPSSLFRLLLPYGPRRPTHPFPLGPPALPFPNLFPWPNPSSFSFSHAQPARPTGARLSPLSLSLPGLRHLALAQTKTPERSKPRRPVPAPSHPSSAHWQAGPACRDRLLPEPGSVPRPSPARRPTTPRPPDPHVEA
jgi:hypothetical protein